jgi:hypothetical protein
MCQNSAFSALGVHKVAADGTMTHRPAQDGRRGSPRAAWAAVVRRRVRGRLVSLVSGRPRRRGGGGAAAGTRGLALGRAAPRRSTSRDGPLRNRSADVTVRCTRSDVSRNALADIAYSTYTYTDGAAASGRHGSGKRTRATRNEVARSARPPGHQPDFDRHHQVSP